MLSDMQEELQLTLSEVISEDVSPVCHLVCLLLASVYFHIHTWRSRVAYTASSSDKIVLYSRVHLLLKVYGNAPDSHFCSNICSTFYGNMANGWCLVSYDWLIVMIDCVSNSRFRSRIIKKKSEKKKSLNLGTWKRRKGHYITESCFGNSCIHVFQGETHWIPKHLCRMTLINKYIQ